ncbi:MAG: VWA domain-containing protein, partial [Phycisphaeraceae bacterium]
VSGSMGSALRITPDILPGLTENLPAGVHVALGSSRPNAGKRFTLYSEYTRDAEALRVAMNEKEINDRTMFGGGGGSDWYNYMGDMMVWADANMPDHAVGATVLVADGVGSGDYATLWDRLRTTRQRLYTVAWGSASLRLEHLDKRTGWTASRGLFNAAWYRNGRYFEPQMNEQLVETYEAILDDVQTPAEYALRVHVRDRLPGRLATTKPAGENRPTLFVLDASGSMMEAINGEQTRLDVAMDVMEQVIADLPEGSHVGLRVYGHRFRAFGSERDKAATDSELLIPIQPLDRRAFTTTLRRINARGATPLAHTMEQVAGDLSGADRPRVIVLTDGVESFRRDPVAAMQSLVEQHPEMELAVVGFQIGEQVDRETLQGMAAAGRGDYHNAMDGDTLVHSVNEALNPTIRYTVHARDGSQTAAGTFGDRHALPEGAYELRARVDGGEARLPLLIPAERTVRLTLDDLPDAEPVADEAEPAPDDAGSSPARFCTQCGAALASDARFCTQCGEPVPE